MVLKKAGDETAETMTNWVRQYTDALFSWALYKTSDRKTAEDLVQDTFLTAFQNIKKFRGDSNPRTWLFAILNNNISAYYRKSYKNLIAAGTESSGNDTAETYDVFFDEDDRWRTTERPVDWDAGDKNLLDDPGFNKVLQGCMEELTAQSRAALHMKFLEQKKGSVICQELNVSTTNFWQILHRAKLQVRKCLELYWFKV